MIILFQVPVQKYPNNAFFRKILQLDKLEGTDFKYDNIVLKFQPKNTQIRHFFFFT